MQGRLNWMWLAASVLAGCGGVGGGQGAEPGPQPRFARAPVIAPASPTSGDDLRVGAWVAPTATVRWSVDGAPLPDSRRVIPASSTSRGQVWTATVSVGGRVVAADAVTVGNAAPPAPAVAVEPAAPIAGLDGLRCEVSESGPDLDGDPIALAHEWRRDGMPWAGGAEVPAVELSPGESWTCVATASDGFELVSAESAPAVVGDFDVAVADPYVEPDLWVEPMQPVAGETATVFYRGELAGEPALVLKYGFDGWALTSELAPHTGTTPESNALYWWEAPMTSLGDGTWEVDVPFPAGVEALHMVVQTPSGRYRDDRDGLEYGWSTTFPYIGPYLSWTDSSQPEAGVVVSFESWTPCRGVVAWREEGGQTRYAVGDVEDTLHHIALPDLRPGTTYTYEVLDASGLSSPTYSFRTFEEGLVDLDLILMADMQDAGEPEEDRWREVAAAAWDAVPDARAVVMPGDLAANDYPGYWWRFFRGGRELFASVPIVPAIGNHDTPGTPSSPDFTSYVRYFELPTGPEGLEIVYAIDLGPVRVLSLDSEVPEEMQPGGAHWAWMEEQRAALLADPAPPRWVFAQYHKPPYDIGARFAGEGLTYRAITELFDGVVDWVFTGHEHIYQRTLPVQFEGALAASDGYGVGPDDGTGYLVVPTAGTRIVSGVEPSDDEAWEMFAFPDPPGEADEVAEEHGFVELRVEGDTLTLRTWGMGTGADPLDPWVRDELRYTKVAP